MFKSSFIGRPEYFGRLTVRYIREAVYCGQPIQFPFFAKSRASALSIYFCFLRATDVTNWYQKLTVVVMKTGMLQSKGLRLQPIQHQSLLWKDHQQSYSDGSRAEIFISQELLALSGNFFFWICNNLKEFFGHENLLHSLPAIE